MKSCIWQLCESDNILDLSSTTKLIDDLDWLELWRRREVARLTLSLDWCDNKLIMVTIRIVKLYVCMAVKSWLQNNRTQSRE